MYVHVCKGNWYFAGADKILQDFRFIFDNLSKMHYAFTFSEFVTFNSTRVQKVTNKKQSVKRERKVWFFKNQIFILYSYNKYLKIIK